jgi:hypothetical protein
MPEAEALGRVQHEPCPTPGHVGARLDGVIGMEWERLRMKVRGGMPPALTGHRTPDGLPPWRRRGDGQAEDWETCCARRLGDVLRTETAAPETGRLGELRTENGEP